MHGVDKTMVRERLKEWGFWLRSARSPSQTYSISRMDSPLTKKRTIKPVYRCEPAENLDLILSFHMDRDAIITLEMYYEKQLPLSSCAGHLGCSMRTFTSKRREAESILIGILRVIQENMAKKCA